jgi:hypothetical protein
MTCASFRSFFLHHKAGGLITFNIGKLFQKWKMVYFLLYNVFYYKVPSLVFTSPLFKNESLSLNWLEISKFTSIWRYVKPFLTSKPNKINDNGELIFRKLKFLGMNISLVTDVLYHSKTIYYLRRLNYFNIGLVASTYDAGGLDLALPMVNTSLLSQLMFIRLISVVRQATLIDRLKKLQSFWQNYSI